MDIIIFKFILIFLHFNLISGDKCPESFPESCSNLGKTDEELLTLIDQYEDKDQNKSAYDLIKDFGYKVNSYEVTTDDGYILSLYRIPCSPKRIEKSSHKGPVLLMHGVCMSSQTFFLNTQKNILPLSLSDDGFDVWIGNNRGVSVSQKHKFLSTDDAAYWDFTWHEIGYYDIPAKIDFILSKTGRSALAYVGVCQGATVLLVMLSERPEYNKKIKLGNLIAPIVFLRHAQSPALTHFSKDLFEGVIAPVLIKNLTNSENISTNHMKCSSKNEKSDIKNCAKVVFGLGGNNQCLTDCSKFPLYMSRIEQLSFGTFKHFLQNYQSRRFGRYDKKGQLNKNPFLKNRKKRTADTSGIFRTFDSPPSYDLTSITSKLVLYSGQKDILNTPKDVQLLEMVLSGNGNLEEHKQVKDYALEDFLLAMDTKEKAQDHLLAKINEANSKNTTESISRVSQAFKGNFPEIALPLFDKIPDHSKCPAPSEKSCSSLGISLNEILQTFANIENEKTRFRTHDFIMDSGYPFEIHEMETDDGYYLSMYRIPFSKKTKEGSKNNPKKSAILLQHGYFGSSTDWVLNDPNSLLPLMLADRGYDVWLGNSRGNSYSGRHAKFPKPQEFWNFSWHESGIFDITKNIDYILNATKTKDMQFVGVSQGTSQFLAGLSEKPEYNNKISLAVLLAPVAYLGNTQSLLVKHFSELGSHFKKLDNFDASNLACGESILNRYMCSQIMFLASGFNFCEQDCSKIPLYMSHRQDSSLKDFVHHVTNAQNDKFQPLANGLNPVKEYNLTNISAKIMMFSGGKDTLSTRKDVTRLEQMLSSTGALKLHKVIKDFEHGDFMWGINNKQLWDFILPQLDEFSKKKA